MKKKVLSLLLVISMIAMMLMGCGGSEEPAEEEVPDGHALQSLEEPDPLFGLYLFAGQFVHDEALSAVLYVPGEQAVHDVAPDFA